MQTLAQVIRALQSEVEASVRRDGPLPAGCRWEADRVIATLDFAVVTTPDEGGASSPRFVVAGNGAGGHSLQIEFKPVNIGRKAAGDAVTEAATHFDQKTPFEALSRILGAPGFDSSARATVFREALESLSTAGMRRTIESLGSSAPLDEATLQRARHLVRQVVSSGPLGLPDGAVLLQELFRHHDPGQLLALVGQHWRTQLDWLG